MKKKTIIKILILTIITLCYTYFVCVPVDDEFYIFGFAYQIAKGYIPYRDFSMIIPPLFPYIVSLVLVIFGKYLILYHLVVAVMISIITYLIKRKIGICSYAIYFLLLITSYFNGYNIFCLFLFIFLLSKEKSSDFEDAIIISLMILTKHTLGILVIPSLIFAKRRLKTFFIYLISFLGLLIYLIVNNNIFQFINYCILGMFDFYQSNASYTHIFVIFEFIILIMLIIALIKTHNKKICYVLCFQIISFPIIDIYHFIISVIPVIYCVIYYLKKNNYIKYSYVYILVNVFAIFYFLGLNIVNITAFIKKEVTYWNESNFMQYRRVSPITDEIINTMGEYVNEYSDYKVYVFAIDGYMIKLNLNLPITKYDLINNGNMGYGGYVQYINEIDDDCNSNRCLFIVYTNNSNNVQINKEIIEYVIKNYIWITSNNGYGIYVNKK